MRSTVPSASGGSSRSGLAIAILMVLLVALALAAGSWSEASSASLIRPSRHCRRPCRSKVRSSLRVGTTYTSRVFGQPMTFQLTPRNPGDLATSDVCPVPATSPRSIVFAHPKGCVEELRIIRPWAVDCRSAGEHPDAAALAAAILEILPTSDAADLGDLQASIAVPRAMFAETYHGRVIEMIGDPAQLARRVDDPDHCRLLPEPGSDDPVIEIRRDLSAYFVLIDVDGELVVFRASMAGYDAATGSEALSRGYALGDPTELRHILTLITDVQFGQRPDTPGSSLPP